jgi:hypothetical protein
MTKSKKDLLKSEILRKWKPKEKRRRAFCPGAATAAAGIG